MTPTMTSETATTLEAEEKELIWTVEMPKEIAEVFGMPEGIPVKLYAQTGGIQAQMDLTNQTSEARDREPGWLLKISSEVAEITGNAEGSVIGIYAKGGIPYVEVYPPPSPEWSEIINQILDQNKDAFEELKRLGD
ncbi:MAG: hypothetical protein ABI977_05605 [Acidobacteriota bacterium]